VQAAWSQKLVTDCSQHHNWHTQFINLAEAEIFEFPLNLSQPFFFILFLKIFSYRAKDHSSANSQRVVHKSGSRSSQV